jgi:hypothetical protein
MEGKLAESIAALVLAASEVVAPLDYNRPPDDPPRHEFGNPVACMIAERPPLYPSFALELLGPRGLLLATVRFQAGQKIAGEGRAVASGSAESFRLTTIDGMCFHQGSVRSDGSGELNFDSTTVIVAGGVVTIAV